MKRRLVSLPAILLISCLKMAAQTSPQLIDKLAFGDPSSESAHHFSGELSKEIKGGLEEPARILLPQASKSWQGGSLFFTIQVDPDQQNYITTKFWGNDVNHNRLYFVCGDQQLSSRHLGDIDMLDIGNDFPFYNDRFFYTTLPLPLSLTKGKKALTLEIRSQGTIWGYGQTWEQYQKDMTEPTRGMYAVYTHTIPAFTPPANEQQGVAPAMAKRKTPGAEVMDKLKTRVNTEIGKLEKSVKPLNQMQMQFLAKSYRVKWSYGYKDKDVIEQVLAGLDELYKAYKANPELAYHDPATPNPDWFGFGPAGDALWLLFDDIQKKLDDTIDDGSGNKITRREAFTDMFLTARKRNQATRRQYTNQTMIKDLYGIYYANKALQLINPGKAIPEKEVLHYLYEAVGLQPWTGSDGEDGKPNYSQGKDYWQLTDKGLTKELGFVGNYGEVIDWCAELYEATGPQTGLPGDEKIKSQVEKIALARSYFRYPMPDDNKYTAMRQETVVGWRDTHYPGDVTYAQRPSWDGSPVQIAAITLNPKLLSYTQQMLDDNQFFYTIEERMKDNGFRVTHGLLFVPDEYEIVKKHASATYKLPMSDGQPDFVFSDEQDGVIAIKNGNEKLYASLYWRARNAINHLARVHDITPHYDRMATVYIEERFDSSAFFYTVPDWTNMEFANGGVKYKDGLHLVKAGEKQPVAKMPEDVPYKPGQEHPLAGRADYYQMQYGNYVIAMNASKHKTFELVVPAGFENAVNLINKEPVKTKLIKLSPLSTVVLYHK